MAKTVDVQLINPFMMATLECLEVMVHMKPQRKRIFIKEDPSMYGEVSGVIGMSNGIVGSCVVSFPMGLAERVVASFLGETPPIIESVLQDGIGEITNMVAGGAKRRFCESGRKFDISTPTVVFGKHPTFLYNPSNCVCIACEFSADGGSEHFLIEVATPLVDAKK